MYVIMVIYVCEIVMYWTSELAFQDRHFYKAYFSIDGSLLFLLIPSQKFFF
jgi:hypothetical protein